MSVKRFGAFNHFVSVEDYVALLTVARQQHEALRVITPCFNAARMIMNAQEARDEAGAIVDRCRCVIKAGIALGLEDKP